MKWPDDADGMVFERLEARGFDFNKEHQIDFNVDFKLWPPPPEAVELLKKHFSNVSLMEPDEESYEEGEYRGYIEFKVTSKLTYDFVVKVQAEVSSMMEPFKGWCNSWGIWEN